MCNFLFNYLKSEISLLLVRSIHLTVNVNRKIANKNSEGNTIHNYVYYFSLMQNIRVCYKNQAVYQESQKQGSILALGMIWKLQLYLDMSLCLHLCFSLFPIFRLFSAVLGSQHN